MNIPRALRQILQTFKYKHSSDLALNRNYCKLYEPAYLEAMRSKIPLYDTINVQIKSYDFPILENYQKFVHNLLKSIEVEIEESWATPAQHTHIPRYKPKSSVIDSEYSLKTYERNIQICDVTATQYPIILRLLEESLPAGVTLNVHEHTDWDDEVRYVPDKDLLQLKTQLQDMGVVKKK